MAKNKYLIPSNSRKGFNIIITIPRVHNKTAQLKLKM